MGVWQENFRRLLSQKEVLIIHGNVRDNAYINKDGKFIRGLTDLIREAGLDLGFTKAVFWGVFFDQNGVGHPPLLSLERIEYLKGDKEPVLRNTTQPNKELLILTQWLRNEVISVNERTIFVIYYVDKITAFSQRGVYQKDMGDLVTVIEKIIENITPNNRLLMVALQDSMLPLEYYTNSPKVSLMEIPLPDKDERRKFFEMHLGGKNIETDKIELLSNVTDGLYFRDLENILNDVLVEFQNNSALSQFELRRIVNRYRLGSEEDPWANITLLSDESAKEDEDEKKGLINYGEKWFKKRVKGQDQAIQEVIKAIQRARAGVVGLASGQETKPKAVYFFAGPTGVGKTFLAKKLAEYLFDTEEAFIRLDMSEFMEEHTVSKLIGAPPGYVGYEKGGVLTNAVKSRPFSVILFDEVEKAHPKILDIFLQLLDDGRLTDSRGQTVFFTESIVIFTSNIGTRTKDNIGHPLTEKDDLENILASGPDSPFRSEKIRDHFVKCVKEFFETEISRPELLNRIGSHIIAFNYISSPESIKSIINSKLNDIVTNFKEKFSNVKHTLVFSPLDTIVEYFFAKYRDSIEKYGGRGLVNAIDDEIGHLLAIQILYSEMAKKTGVKFVITLNDKGEMSCSRS